MTLGTRASGMNGYHIKYAVMFLETSYFDKSKDVVIKNLAGYEERTRVLEYPDFVVDIIYKSICLLVILYM